MRTARAALLAIESKNAALVRHIAENAMLNGETIRLDGPSVRGDRSLLLEVEDRQIGHAPI